MGDVTVRVLEPGDEALVEAFLQPRLDSSMFLLANSRRAGLAYRDELYHGVYAGAFNGDGEIVALASHFWNGVMNLQAPGHLEAVCRAAVEASGRPVRGAVGPTEQAAACVALYDLPETGDAVQLNAHENLYALDLDELRLPEALADGRVIGWRRATASRLST